MPELITTRKEQHIDLCATQDVEASDRGTGFAQLSFRPCTLPELDWNELDTNVELCGRSFSAPFIISGMTFGIERRTIRCALSELTLSPQLRRIPPRPRTGLVL